MAGWWDTARIWGLGIKNDYYSCAVDQWCINEEGQVWDLSVSCVRTWNVTPSGYMRREKSWPFALLFLRLGCPIYVSRACKQTVHTVKGQGKQPLESYPGSYGTIRGRMSWQEAQPVWLWESLKPILRVKRWHFRFFPETAGNCREIPTWPLLLFCLQAHS